MARGSQNDCASVCRSFLCCSGIPILVVLIILVYDVITTVRYGKYQNFYMSDSSWVNPMQVDLDPHVDTTYKIVCNVDASGSFGVRWRHQDGHVDSCGQMTSGEGKSIYETVACTFTAHTPVSQDGIQPSIALEVYSASINGYSGIMSIAPMLSLRMGIVFAISFIAIPITLLFASLISGVLD